MSAELLLAIDVGTGSARAILFTADLQQVSVSQREYRHDEIAGVPGSQAFDTDGNWAAIAGCIQRALVDAGQPATAIKAVSATSMREGMVLYDQTGAEIWACPNIDSRAGQQASDMVADGTAHEIYDISGDWVSITAPARFRWIAQHQPEVLARLAKFATMADWVTHRLTGRLVSDPSLASSLGMFDLAARDWSSRILEICGLDRTTCPPVVDSGTIAGEVTAQAARQTGLAAGTPVVVGGADTQLALLGAGVTEPGRFTVVGGSFWQHTAVLDKPLIDPRSRLRTLCHTVPERWMIEGIGFHSGSALRWFRDSFCQIETEIAARDGTDAYDLLEREAREVPPGADGVVAIFSNLMQASRWVHASPSFMGFDITRPSHSGRIQCFRALQESAAYVTRGHLGIIRELADLDVTEVLFAGGAAKGMLWPQIVADVLGIPVRIPVVKESTALGAAAYAAQGAGLVDDASRLVRSCGRFEADLEPQTDAVEIYDELFEQWRQLYPMALAMSEAGLVRPLWRAAGT